MTQTPHDALFKATFSKLEHARSELMLVLPHAIAERVDWESLALASGSFIDEELASSACDLLFTAQWAERSACFYVLFEHQSEGHALMPFRMLKYMTRVWDQFLAQHGGARLPLVLPVVLHHDSSRWGRATRFLEHIDVHADLKIAVSPFVPDFTFVLEDLSDLDDAALRAQPVTPLVRVTKTLLQHGRSVHDLTSLLESCRSDFVALLTMPNASEALRTLASYTLRVTKGPREQLRNFFRKLGPVSREAFMTAAEELIQEGFSRGEAKIVLRLLALRFGPLAADVESRVANASTKELEMWAERVLTATTLQDVLGE